MFEAPELPNRPELRQILCAVGLPTPPNSCESDGTESGEEFGMPKADLGVEPNMELSKECERRLQQLLQEKGMRHLQKFDGYVNQRPVTITTTSGDKFEDRLGECLDNILSTAVMKLKHTRSETGRSARWR